MLTVSYVFLRGSSWVGSGQIHTIMETVATVLALIVGALSLLRYYTKKNNTFLFIGTGFLGTAFLDGYHTVVTSAYFESIMPSVNASLIPWSWIASRMFLSIFMLLSYSAWQCGENRGKNGHIPERYVYQFTILFAVSCVLFFAFVPLPLGYFPKFIFPRPEEFLPALLFGLALIGYLKKGRWRYNSFEHWLVLSLIVGFISQTVFMSFSGNLFDFEFDAAHLLKKVSYTFVLIGLLYNMFEVFTRAEEANRAKTDFLNVMSHELRTPLTVVLGYTPILTNPQKLPSVKNLMTAIENQEMEEIEKNTQKVLDDFATYGDRIGSSGKHLLSLINDLLDISKIEAGEMKLNLEAISTNHLVRSVAEYFQNAAKQKGLVLEYDSHGETVTADQIRIKQMLFNLVGNAIKFTDKGSIKIWTEQKNSLVKFFVSDTGCGMPENKIDTVFEPFTQVDTSSTRAAGGTGLGLTITKRLAILHGGNIDISSTFGHGTTICFTIPSHQSSGD